MSEVRSESHSASRADASKMVLKNCDHGTRITMASNGREMKTTHAAASAVRPRGALNGERLFFTSLQTHSRSVFFAHCPEQNR